MTHIPRVQADQDQPYLAKIAWPVQRKHHPHDWLVYPLLAIVVGLFAGALAIFYVPAHQGPDQNGYDVAARMLVEHHRLYFTPHNPWQFIGKNEVQVPNGRIYPKYPPGVSILAAIGWMVGGHARDMYLLDPVATVLACWISFFLFRTMVGSFLSLMGVIWLACNPLVLFFANYGDSHGAALLATVLGFWLLLTWWRKGSLWRGVLAGAVLGFCCWIRYTEFLWLFPLLAVALWQLLDRERPVWQCLLVVAAFSLPVTILAGFNWQAFGEPWRTAYSFCHEQNGFGWQYFIGNSMSRPPHPGNWRIFLNQISHVGLFLLFPLAIIGGLRLFWSHWKLALVLALWIVPSTTVYLFYYWAPDNIGYTRFFIDVLPPLIMFALWLLGRAMGDHRQATAVAVGTLTLLGSGYNLYHIAPRLVASTASKLNLIQAAEALHTFLPRGSVVFADTPVDNDLASMGGYRLYSTEMFTIRYVRQMRQVARHSGPQISEPLKARRYLDLVGHRRADGTWKWPSPTALQHDELHLIHQAWRKHRTVALLGQQRWPILPGIRRKLLASWNPPAVGYQRWSNRWSLWEILPFHHQIPSH